MCTGAYGGQERASGPLAVNHHMDSGSKAIAICKTMGALTIEQSLQSFKISFKSTQNRFLGDHTLVVPTGGKAK